MSSTYDGNRPIGSFSSIQTWSTYNWINNEAFYGLIPQSYQDFYHRFVKQWFYWYDGFVPYFHNSQSGMVSTHIAYAILKKLAEKTVGGKLLFDDEGVPDEHEIELDGKVYNSVDFAEKWAKDNDFKPTIKQAFEWAYAGGDSLLKLDTDGKELFLLPMRKDNYLIDTDFRGRICKFQGFVYAYTKLIDNRENDRQMYYIVEEREYVNGKPKFRVDVKTSHASQTNGKMMYNAIQSVPYDRLPKDVLRKFKRDYPDVRLGVWKNIPFEDLGIYQIKATRNVHFLPDAPFGESLLSPLISDLMTYDYYKSSLTTNLYTTRDKVLLPQGMETPQLDDPDSFYADQNNWFNGLDSFLTARVPYTDPESQKPIFIQPELRDWTSIRNLLLQSFAMKLNVDERTIMSSIIPNAEKPTAREISVDEDTTASFIQDKRDLNINSLNKLLDTVIKFYGFTTEKVTLTFSRSGMSNINNIVTIATLLKQNRLGDTKSLLEMVWQDKNDKQIELMLQALEKEQEEALEKKMEQTADVEENIEQQNNNTEYHIPKKGD